MKKTIIIALSVAIVAGGGSFFGGMKYAESKAPARGAAGGQRQFQQGFGQNGTRPTGQAGQRGGIGGGFVSGDVISKDDKSITVKMRDGSSKIVFYSGSTEVSKFAQGSADDIETGKTVTVTGKANDDGSVTATSIQMRPPMPATPPVQTK